jgi:virginiamycin A acetyltransferase
MNWLDDSLPSHLERRQAVGGCDWFADRSAVVWGDVQVGRFSIIGPHSTVVGHSPIQIGAFSRFGTRFHCVTHEQHHQELPSTFMFGDVFDLDWSHGCGAIGMSRYREVTEEFPVTIGSDVTVGNDVHVFGGVTIGDGCIIRPGSLVNRDCVAFGIYEGVPARLVGMRFGGEWIEELLDLKWWNWPLDRLRANSEFFRSTVA